MTRIYTSRWANKELAHLACQPVGISRGTPRFPTGYRYRQVRELAPDDATWAEQEEEDFRRAYERQLDEMGLDAIVTRLTAIHEQVGLPLVLLCFEPADQFCHRHVLRGWLRARGMQITELQPDDLPTRPDSPQVSLFESYREDRT